MITSTDIENAKRRLHLKDPNHQHEDCIRIAYEWLDAQKKLKNPRSSHAALKHYIEEWAGRYVSRSDVEVAAEIHPLIKGHYPSYNLSSRLVEPSLSRLDNIAEANTQSHYRENHVSNVGRRYARSEV